MSKNKIFNLNNFDINFNKNLKNNLALLKKTFGSKFIIKHNEIEVPVVLSKKKLDSNNFEFYVLNYDEPDRTDELLPFKISFFDPIINKFNGNSYINNIRKTNKISGSSLVKLVIEINKVLGVKKTFLWDGSSVQCGNEEIDLGLMKIFEKGYTFYMNFGFKPDTSQNNYLFLLFDNTEQLENKLTLLLSKVKKITITSIIKQYEKLLDMITQIIKTQDYKEFHIQNIETYTFTPIDSNQLVNVKDPKKKIFSMFEEISQVLQILGKTKKKYLIDYLVELFKTNCADCATLLKYLCYNYNYKIIWKKNIIQRNYLIYFHYLIAIRKYFYYSYTF
jgi:hypothetical protein